MAATGLPGGWLSPGSSISTSSATGTAPIGGSVKPSPMNTYGNPGTFTAAATTQAGDYDKIMSQYDDFIKSSAANPLTAGSVGATSTAYNPIAPQTSQYQQSGDVTGSISNLSDLATTGGYSPQNIADIRARDISPIRSIYANAQQNVERQKALTGGYSPNYGAVQAKMARDEASQIGDTTTNVNAGIAQSVAGNRIASASPYASASGTANAARTAVDQHNADIINQINQSNSINTSNVAGANADRALSTGMFNTQAALDAAKTNRSGTLGAIQGKTSLYGTTPALTNVFGNQVAQAAQLGQNQQQINNQKYQTFGVLSGVGRG